ncbi:MAG TPA: A/G-specific adenine glycosylase [Candidatus Limnocylindria bacterium]|nr:A/G-specific adenine glycosylase [Candidatus Limnocylindria bacterium]
MPALDQTAQVRRPVLEWYERNRRDFPWRRTRDPYAVLVSEVMLQQTQASRVVDRFVRFMDRFPTADALAAASTAAVLAEWSGLGYNRRALALQRAAAIVARQGWPCDVPGLESLPGVGPYTARAVASLAFDVPIGVVDTNVRRWLVRRFGDPDAPAALQARADALAAGGTGATIAAWTHASMEFGAAICRSRNPHCVACPIADGCPSRGTAAVVPVPRQPALEGSDREVRGAMLRHLASAAGHALSEAAARERVGASVDGERWERILAGLERDGLLHRRGGTVALGAATIGG